jgi:GntR family transcriptional regulator, transcriptional repressor for pyruvate dehydrogenase complex
MVKDVSLFREIERTNAAREVQSQLLEAIDSGRLSVGERLPSEHELARSFGVSRPVVREALGTLRSLGLVTSQSGRGTFVAATRPTGAGLYLLGRYSTEELYEARSLLEVPGAGLAAKRRTEAHLATLRRIVSSHDDCDDPEEWVKQDLAFHVALAAATGNAVHMDLVEHLRELQAVQSLAVARVAGRLTAASREHRTILDAVVDREEARARDAMAKHLKTILAESRRLGV